MTIRRIGLLTGGGDCPGLNAVIRAAARSAHERGWEVWGIHGAFGGMLDPESFQRLWPRDVRGILNRGGPVHRRELR
jgi:6-phosphofructokinase 1